MFKTKCMLLFMTANTMLMARGCQNGKDGYDLLKESGKTCFTNDYVRVAVMSFDDEYYSELKKLSENGEHLHENYDWKAIHEDVIYFE